MLGLLLLLLGRCRWGSIVGDCLCRRDGIIALGLFLFILGVLFIFGGMSWV